MRRLPWLAAGALLLLWGAAVASAGERLDVFDARGNRVGYGIVTRHGAVELYDERSNRIRHGHIGRDGRAVLYDLNGKRLFDVLATPCRSRPPR